MSTFPAGLSLLDPFPWYRTMRESQPVTYDPRSSNWSVFRYDDVVRVLSDYTAFSSQVQGRNTQSVNQPFAASLINLDPPRHRQMRALVTQAFTPRAIEALAPRITAIVHDLLDRVAPSGHMDAVEDLSTPLPVIVIAELLGIPAADRERFKRWSDAIVSVAVSGGMPPYQAQREMVSYFMETIEQRRRAPGDDLISALLEAEIGGERLTLAELLGFCALLLVAGNETTTNLLGNALLCLAERPEVWARLRGSPALLPQAIEEVLRYRSPVQVMFREAPSDVVLGGQTIPQGAHVAAWIGSANHDESQFHDPERFDIERQPNRHLGFGYGIHYCLGAPLARLEARIALAAMLERFEEIHRISDAPLEALPSLLLYGVRSLPLGWRLTESSGR
jgi:cytochrome P450